MSPHTGARTVRKDEAASATEASAKMAAAPHFRAGSIPVLICGRSDAHPRARIAVREMLDERIVNSPLCRKYVVLRR